MGSKASGAGRETGIQVIARAGEILRLLGKSEHGTTLRALADDTGLPRSTVHRIVVALAAEDLVAWDPRRGVTELGLGLVSLAVTRRQRLRNVVRPYLEALVRRVDETADLVVGSEDQVVVVDQVMARRLLIVSAIGAVLPLHCTACGKALLAALPPEDVEHTLPAKLQAFTPSTITDRAVLLAQLAEVRSSRLAFDYDEHTPGVSGVGAAIRDAWGEIAVVTIPVPSLRFAGREDELGAALLATCDELEAALGRA